LFIGAGLRCRGQRRIAGGRRTALPADNSTRSSILA